MLRLLFMGAHFAGWPKHCTAFKSLHMLLNCLYMSLTWRPFAIFIVFVLQLFVGIPQAHSEHYKLQAKSIKIAQIIATSCKTFFFAG